MTTSKYSRLRFNTAEDLLLLQAVLAENPFEGASRWQNIQNTIQQSSEKPFTVRTLKEHVYILVTTLIVQNDGSVGILYYINYSPLIF